MVYFKNVLLYVNYNKIKTTTNTSLIRSTIFNLFYLMAYKQINKILWHSKICNFCWSDKNRYNFDWFAKNNNSNCLPFVLQSDFLKNQVLILVYKDFWYQKLTNQMQPYYGMWPVRCSSVIWPVYLWFKTEHSHWMAIVVLAVVIFFNLTI